jgi:SPP1 gp7 family putative phage head morphogenesis protein
MKSEDKELEFTESLYDEAEKQIKEVYKEQKENRDKLLQEIALIMLTYTVLDGLMSLTSKDKKKEYNRLSNTILRSAKDRGETQGKVIKDILTSTANKTFNHYSYNADLKDVRKIIENNFKGKHFSTRVWENENEVARHLHKQVNDFLNGKINVNQIKKGIERTYNANAYNSKRLVETEVNRCSSNAFDRFCKETDVKKVRYNATLDSRLCSDCAQYHDKVFNFNEKIELPRHPLCRCFYTIED